MIEAELSRSVARWCSGATGVTGAAKLSGGASQETWRFDIVHAAGRFGAILRRSPKGYGAAPTRAAGLAAEARLMQLAHDAGLPSPKVIHVLTPEDDLGTGFIMARVEGETIARKIISGDKAMVAQVYLAKGAIVPEHHHESEQITYILEGALKFEIGGKEIVVGKGQVLRIPSNVPHRAVALEDTLDLDIFSPIRHDWIKKDDDYLRRGETDGPRS